MLKKTALSLFGLAAMLICFNPPKANAGVIVATRASLPASSLCPSLPVRGADTLCRYTGQIPISMGQCSCAQVGDIVRAFTGPDIGFREDMNTVNSLYVARTGGGKSSKRPDAAPAALPHPSPPRQRVGRVLN